MFVREAEQWLQHTELEPVMKEDATVIVSLEELMKTVIKIVTCKRWVHVPVLWYTLKTDWGVKMDNF
jgi:hypothetical protein